MDFPVEECNECGGCSDLILLGDGERFLSIDLDEGYICVGS